MIDETLFHPDRYKLKHWMTSNEPILKVSKYSPKMPKINVCSVISEKFGSIYHQYSEQYFISKDMTLVLQSIRDFLGEEAKIVIFWDNARIHTSDETRNFASREDINIELC